jgi:hypothetical protein
LPRGEDRNLISVTGVDDGWKSMRRSKSSLQIEGREDARAGKAGWNYTVISNFLSEAE